MHPFRLLILAILIYAAILLIRSSRKKKIPKKTEPDLNKPRSTSDVLVEDPICSSLVPKEQAVKLQYGDSMIYFCSEECCRKFMKEKNL